MRVIPPARTRPRAPLHVLLPARRLPVTVSSGIIIIASAGRRLRAVLLRFPPEHHPLQHRKALIRLGQPGGLPADQLPQLLVDPDQLSVLLPQLPDLQGLLLDLHRLLLDDLQRPRQPFLSRRTARRRRPGTARDRQNPCRRSHEPQQTLPSQANHAPARRVAAVDRASLRGHRHSTSEYLRAIGLEKSTTFLAACSLNSGEYPVGFLPPDI